MKFEKSRVYTALNADELKRGSKCIFADTVSGLRQAVQDKEFDTHVQILTRVSDDDSVARFLTSNYHQWVYAYLIEPPAEPKYKPFESVEKAMEAIKKHGGWVKDVEANRTLLVHAYEENDRVNMFMIGFSWVRLEELYEIFVFADDGSPCGELVEE